MNLYQAVNTSAFYQKSPTKIDCIAYFVHSYCDIEHVLIKRKADDKDVLSPVIMFQYLIKSYYAFTV